MTTSDQLIKTWPGFLVWGLVVVKRESGFDQSDNKEGHSLFTGEKFMGKEK